jgi:hypothetical protein
METSNFTIFISLLILKQINAKVFHYISKFTAGINTFWEVLWKVGLTVVTERNKSGNETVYHSHFLIYFMLQFSPLKTTPILILLVCCDSFIIFD